MKSSIPENFLGRALSPPHLLSTLPVSAPASRLRAALGKYATRLFNERDCQ
jgi:hypothetical protein